MRASQELTGKKKKKRYNLAMTVLNATLFLIS